MTETKKQKRKRLIAKVKTKAEAEAKARRLRAQGRNVEVRKDPITGLYFIYEIILLGVTLGIFGALLRQPPQN